MVGEKKWGLLLIWSRYIILKAKARRKMTKIHNFSLSLSGSVLIIRKIYPSAFALSNKSRYAYSLYPLSFLEEKPTSPLDMVGLQTEGIHRERIHPALRSWRPQGRRKGFHSKRRCVTGETTGWTYWTYWTYWCLFFIFFIVSVLWTVHAKDIRLL